MELPLGKNTFTRDMEKRKRISTMLLLAYLFVLAASFVPHHHHHLKDFCTDTISQHNHNVSDILVDCCKNHDKDGCAPKESKGCTDSGCIAKNVYTNHISNGKSTNLAEAPAVDLPFILLHETYNEESSNVLEVHSKIAYNTQTTPIKELLLTGGVSLRAPPAFC